MVLLLAPSFLSSHYICHPYSIFTIFIPYSLFSYHISCIYFLFSILFRKKHISLSYAFCPSAWWNRQKRFLFLNGVNNVLFPKSKLSKFHAPGNDTTDTPRRWSYINISIRDLLYINVWRGCLLFIIIWWRVLLSLKFR